MKSVYANLYNLYNNAKGAELFQYLPVKHIDNLQQPILTQEKYRLKEFPFTTILTYLKFILKFNLSLQ